MRSSRMRRLRGYEACLIRPRILNAGPVVTVWVCGVIDGGADDGGRRDEAVAIGPGGHHGTR